MSRRRNSDCSQDFNLGALGNHWKVLSSELQGLIFLLKAPGSCWPPLLLPLPCPWLEVPAFCHIPPWGQPLAGKKVSDVPRDQGRGWQLPQPVPRSEGRDPRNPRSLDPSADRGDLQLSPTEGTGTRLGSPDPGPWSSGATPTHKPVTKPAPLSERTVGRGPARKPLSGGLPLPPKLLRAQACHPLRLMLVL